MNRNSKIILLFLSTIISIILIFVAYYGIDRYIVMHLNSIDKYVDNYHKLSSIPDKVVLSFSTTQDKFNKIKPMIKSLLDQTIKINKIDINLPPKKTDYKIPKEYKLYAIFIL